MNYKEQMWACHHHRFGLAGQDQADIIESLLKTRPCRVLTIGCGPNGEHIKNLAKQTQSLVAADKCPVAVRKAAAMAGNEPNVRFVVSHAQQLCFANESFGDIVAFGLFAEVSQGETMNVMVEFYRISKYAGHLMLTNSVAHHKEHYRDCGVRVGFELVQEHEGYCPAASGPIPQRYLLVFRKK